MNKTSRIFDFFVGNGWINSDVSSGATEDTKLPPITNSNNNNTTNVNNPDNNNNNNNLNMGSNNNNNMNMNPALMMAPNMLPQSSLPINPTTLMHLAATNPSAVLGGTLIPSGHPLLLPNASGPSIPMLNPSHNIALPSSSSSSINHPTTLINHHSSHPLHHPSHILPPHLLPNNSTSTPTATPPIRAPVPIPNTINPSALANNLNNPNTH